MSAPQSDPPLFASVWQLIDATVLFPVQPGPAGEAPAVMPTPQGPCVPVWVDVARATSMLAPGFVLRQTPITELIRSSSLRPETGIVVEPGATYAVFVPGAQRLALQPLCVPFPEGAQTAWGQLPDEARPLLDELSNRARRIKALTDLWLARFQVEDMRERVAVVYDTARADAETDQLIVSALYEGIGRVNPAYPVQLIAFHDLPEGTGAWLTGSVPPAYQDRP